MCFGIDASSVLIFFTGGDSSRFKSILESSGATVLFRTPFSEIGSEADIVESVLVGDFRVVRMLVRCNASMY